MTAPVVLLLAALGVAGFVAAWSGGARAGSESSENDPRDARWQIERRGGVPFGLACLVAAVLVGVSRCG